MNFETLETRQLMSATLNPVTHELTAKISTDKWPEQEQNELHVTLDASGTKLIVNDNGVKQTFLKSQVKKIKLVGTFSPDSLSVAKNIAINSEFFPQGCGPIDNDFVSGGKGNDTFHGAGGSFMQGNGGNDTFTLTAEDTAFGGDGNDTFNILGTMTTAEGGTGDDKFVMKNYAFVVITGDSGVDTADFSMHNENLTIGNASALDAKGLGMYSGETGAVGDFSDGTFVSDDIEVLKGGKGNDRLYGWAGVNQLWGNDGNDLLDGGAGKDALFGGNGNDTLYTRDGVADFLSGGFGTDKAKIDAFDATTGVEIFLA